MKGFSGFGNSPAKQTIKMGSHGDIHKTDKVKQKNSGPQDTKENREIMKRLVKERNEPRKITYPEVPKGQEEFREVKYVKVKSPAKQKVKYEKAEPVPKSKEVQLQGQKMIKEKTGKLIVKTPTPMQIKPPKKLSDQTPEETYNKPMGKKSPAKQAKNKKKNKEGLSKNVTAEDYIVQDISEVQKNKKGLYITGLDDGSFPNNTVQDTSYLPPNATLYNEKGGKKYKEGDYLDETDFEETYFPNTNERKKKK